MDTKRLPEIDNIRNSTHPFVLEYNDKYEKMELDGLITLCNNDDPIALYELASRYRLGVDGVGKNEEKAAYLYYQVLKKQRNAMAVRYIGWAFLDGVFGEEFKINALEWFELSSAWGSSDAAEDVGLIYLFGEIVEENYGAAIEWFEKALSQGSKHVLFNLGDCYRILGDYPKAKYYLEKSIEEGVYDAYIYLGQLYEDGLGVEQDATKAYNMYSLAYQHDINPEGAYYMARMYFDGRGVPEDNAKAYQLFLEALKLGGDEANYYLGILNYLDENENPVVKQNADVALQFLSAVPEHMEAKANERMGYICVKEGRNEEARKYFEKAASLGNKDAIQMLARLNATPEDERREFMKFLAFEADIEELLKQYENGVQEAAFYIAQAYEKGERGATINYDKAISYYQKMIEQGGRVANQAYFQLAYFYLEGKGVVQNTPKAISYFENLGKNDFGAACSVLGEIYSKGQYTQVDIEKAVYWHLKGADAGELHSDKALFLLYIQGKVGNKQEVEKAITHLCKVLKKEPNDVMANWYMAQFCESGVSENGKVLVRKDKNEALQYYKVAAEGGYAKAFNKMGHIFSEPDSPCYDYEAALKAFENGVNSGHVLSWYSLAMVHLLPEFENEIHYNPLQGINAAKKFLENGDGANGLKELVMGMMMAYYETREEEASYCQQEYLYLFNHFGTMGLSYTSEENKNLLSEIIEDVTKKLIMYLDESIQGINDLRDMLTELDQISEQNPYVEDCTKGLLSKHYVGLAEIYLNINELEKAKLCYEKAARKGSAEAEVQLRRFKTNMFGKLTYQ